jgi:hypothetical protein
MGKIEYVWNIWLTIWEGLTLTLRENKLAHDSSTKQGRSKQV